MLIRMDFVFYALAAIGALALLFVGGFLLAGLWQPQEPRHVDPDLLIEMPRPAAESQGRRRWCLSDEEAAALVELLRLAIAWNPLLRSPRIEQWKATGKAPDELIFDHYKNGMQVGKRLVCQYPKIPTYKGSGNTEDPERFVCK